MRSGNDLADEEIDDYFSGLEKGLHFFDMEKAWAGVDFLLTGKPWDERGGPADPVEEALRGGVDTEWEAAYDCVQLIRPDEVGRFADGLAALREPELESRFDTQAFNRASLYPAFESWGAEAVPYLMEMFSKLREFYRDAAREGEAMLISLD